MKRFRASFNRPVPRSARFRIGAWTQPFFLFLALLSALPTVQAQVQQAPIPKSVPKSTIEKEEKAIPQSPSAPKPLWMETPTHSQRCRRTFLYRGEILSCDSVLSSDASGLRTILDQTPEALAELEAYQAGRRRIRNLAYFGTGGLLLAFLGPSVARLIPDSKTSSVLSSILSVSGVGLAGGVVLFGGVTLRNNENHLSRAVELYNQANPKDPIELQFSTSFSF